MRRYAVRPCDEDQRTVANHDTRRKARYEARRMNAQTVDTRKPVRMVKQ